MMSALNYIFNISILIGFVIPLLNLLTGWFGSFLGVGADLDFDASPDAGAGADIGAGADLDAGADPGAGADLGAGGNAGTSVGNSALIPFNVMCLCLFLVVFGALGHIAKLFMSNAFLIALLLIVCLAFAALAYWALYTLLIKRLKNSDASATSFRDLRGKKAEVTLVIKADSIGTISLRDSTGAALSFRAKMDPDLKNQMPDAIATGETIIITDIDKEDKLCFVSLPVNKFKNLGG